MTFPACFNTQVEFDQWNHWRKVSAEKKVKICTDCTPEYKTEMQLQGRCKIPAERSIATPKPEKVKRCAKCGEKDPAKFAPKNYYRCNHCCNEMKKAYKAKLSVSVYNRPMVAA